MSRPPPTLRKHVTGVHTVRWGGRDYYFTRDAKESRRLFLNPDSDHPGALARWSAWQARKEANRPGVKRRLTVAEMAKRFLEELHDEGRFDAERYYRLHLVRFLQALGTFYSDEVDAVLFNTFSKGLRGLGLASRTIGHDLTAAKRLWNWGSEPARQLCPAINFRGIRPPPRRKSTPEEIPLDILRDQIKLAAKHTPELEAWLSLSYLCCLRPSEVLRLVHGQGRLRAIPPEQHGRQRLPSIPNAYIELFEHKTSHKVESPRIIPLSEEALLWYRSLAELPAQRKRTASLTDSTGRLRIHALQDAYAKRCAQAGVPALPHKLRDSGATHLRAAGVPAADVDLILGHEPATLLPTYGRASIRLLRESASLLTLR